MGNTTSVNERKKCFRKAYWLKRKTGFYIANYRDYDECGNKRVYAHVYEEDIVCEPADFLLSQRNPFTEMPFRIFSWNLKRTPCPTCTVAKYYAKDLMTILYDTVSPGPYARELERFEININVGWVPEMWTVKPGRYDSKRKTYKTLLRVDRGFDDLPEDQQRDVLIAGIRACLYSFLTKLKSARKQCDVTKLYEETMDALSNFAQQSGTKALAALHVDEPGILEVLLGVRTEAKKRKLTLPANDRTRP